MGGAAGRYQDTGVNLKGRRSRGGLRTSAELSEIVRSALRMGSGSKDGPFIFFQDRKPMTNVTGMIVAVFEPQAQIGAEESSAEFGNQFLACIPFVSEAFAPEIPVKARRM